MADDQVRIFVSSPADVGHERALVKDLIERLAQEYLPWFKLQAILWEEEALTADRSFQAGLTRPEDCEIVLVILWTRLGSPLPEEPYRGMTGTEWEFVNAVEAAVHHGRPEVLVYKKTAPKLVDITDAEGAAEALADRHRLETFFRDNFFNPDDTFRRAFRTFDGDAAFRELVEVQLRKLLNRRISVERRYASGELRWQGSPFRPDRPFDTADERVFTGREQEVRDLLTRLHGRALAGRGLLLLNGPSGAGKTSLLRAGLLPRLTRPYQFSEQATVRACMLDLDGSGDPLAALAAAFCADDSLGPALARLGLDADGLPRLFRGDPALAARQLVGALAAPAGMVPRAALLIDRLETVLGAPPGDPDGLHAFAGALRALLDTGAVWVVAALRSDALPGLALLPPLHDLLDGDALLTLEPPAALRLRQIVEIPARIAGIEVASPAHGPGLLDLLETEVAGLRAWAPPLQALLDASLAQAAAADERNEQGELVLGTAQHAAQGGLSGTVVARAEALWRRLDAQARAALPRFCRSLVALDPDGGEAPLPRQGDLAVLRADPHCARLLDALVEARLVVTEGLRDPAATRQCPPIDYRLGAAVAAAWRQGHAGWRARFRRAGNGAPATTVPDPPPPVQPPPWREVRPVASLVHPALLTDFAPIRDWLADPANRATLARRAALGRQARLWRRTDCNRDYLLRDAPYAQLRQLAIEHAAELEPLEQDFLAASAAQLRFLRRRSRLVQATGLALATLFVVASITAGLAWQASGAARVNLNRAKLKEADLHIARGNTPQAVTLALAAGPDLPERAVRTLSQAFGNNRLMAMVDGLRVAADGPRLPALNADGDLLATLLPDGHVRLWRLRGDQFLPERDLTSAGPGLHSLIIAGDQQVFGIGADGVWRLPAAPGEPPGWPCGSGPAPVFALDDARRLLALGRPSPQPDAEDRVCVLDLGEPGRVVVDIDLPDGALRSLDLAADGRTLLTATAGGRAQVIDLGSGDITLALPADGPVGRPFTQAVFDATGGRIAVAATDERIRLFRRDGSPLAVLEYSSVGGRRVKVHNSAVRGLAFGLAGLFLVSVDDEGQVVRWSMGELDGDDGAPAVSIGSHDLSIGSVAVIDPPPDTANESLVLTSAIDHTARLWGLQSGRRFGVLGHDGPLTSAEFHAGGRRVASFSARDGSLRLWSVQPASRLAYRFQHPDHVWHVAVHPAPAALAPAGAALLLATAAFDGGVRLWRYDRTASDSLPSPMQPLPGHRGRARRVAFSADGGRLASVGFDGAALVNDLISGTGCRAAVTDNPKGRVFQVLFDPAGRWLLTTSDDPKQPVRAFDPADCHPLGTGEALAHPPPPPAAGKKARARPVSAPVQAAALLGLPGRTLVATGDDAGWLRVIEVDGAGRWRARCALATPVGSVNAVAISPAGDRVALAGSDEAGALVRIDDTGCTVDASLDGHGDLLYSVAFAPDGSQVLTASLDRTARLWDANGAPRTVFTGHRDRVYTAAFSPDGNWILTASRDGQMRLWQRPRGPTDEVETVQAFLPLPAHAGGVADAVFSPDGQYVLGAYWENAALGWRLWSDARPDPARLRRWGPARARLALIDEAYRFEAANRVGPEPESALGEGD